MSGPFRVIEASSNSATVTLIGENREPCRVPFDQLVKVPKEIDDTPIKGLTARGNRGRPKKGNKNLAKNTCASIKFSTFRTSFSSTTDVHHADWHCPGKLMCQGAEVECSIDVALKDIVPNVPFGDLKFSSPYELSRLLSILSQSHLPESWRTARMLDRSYDTTSPIGLGLAWSFYRRHCVHMTLATVTDAGRVLPNHPSRGKCDPYNIANIADNARKYADTHPWTSSSWKEVKPRKNFIILPTGFERVLEGFKTETQTAVVLKKPEDLKPEWFVEDFSSIILFNPAEFAGTMRWRGAWTLLMQTIARGTELIVLAGPENDREWRRSVDMLRDLCEETIAQRPSLQNHIRCLLPHRSQYEMIGAGFRTATHEQGKLFTESTSKRFWTSTMAQCSAFISLAPFSRRPHGNTRNHVKAFKPAHSQQRQKVGTFTPTRQNYKKLVPFREQRPKGGHTSRNTLKEAQICRIGNQVYTLTPVHDHKKGAPRKAGRKF
ncbi:unnamed protein product [Nippostrongylus brasiliensis]|uniref:Integrase catalytic domain-containing protein n=1 Tax=Nippostrongylus brasiliensis TaxID=27835 RepID=A0A0N4XTC4_NIPBR|nr:unnamed protein product [Nippostrongylus brasiliensis]